MANKIIKELEESKIGFSYPAYYDGDFSLPVNIYNNMEYKKEHDPFYLNALNNKKVNSYSAFLDKYLYSKFGDAQTKSYYQQHLFPSFISRDFGDGTGRHLNFYKFRTLLSLVDKRYINSHEISEDETKIDDYIRSYFRSMRAIYADIEKNKEESTYYELIPQNNLPKNTLYYQVGLTKELYQKLAVESSQLSKIFPSTLPLAEFKECFLPDELYLIIMKSILDEAIVQEKLINKVCNPILEVRAYQKMIDEIDKNYNPKISYFNSNTKRIEKYSYADLKHDLAELLSKHPEFKTFYYDEVEENDENLKSKDVMSKITRDYELQQMEKELQSSWIIIPGGTAKSKNIAKRQNPNAISNHAQYQKQYERLLYKIDTFDETNYKYQIQGINNFQGYIGYIYKNGKVIFEKFYESTRSTTPALKSNATYIMDYQNFVSFSKLTKLEIISYIKTTNDPRVKRIYHDFRADKTAPMWKNKIISLINGMDYTPEVEALIDSLIESKEINKKR